MGGEVLDRLARLLLLQAGDELWKEHMSTLRELGLTAQLNDHGHRSAVADCVFHSYQAWDAFQEQVEETFLAKLLTFPMNEITGVIPEPTSRIRLTEDAELVLA